jgi:hypothetical protein
MDEASMAHYITTSFAGVETEIAFGYTFFFSGADHTLAFATIASTDNAYEHVSQLDRPGVYRLNIGVSPQTFQALFSPGHIDLGSYDFTALDTIMPHPDYAAQAFICVLSPSDATFEQQVRPLLAEAYARSLARDRRRQARSDREGAGQSHA